MVNFDTTSEQLARYLDANNLGYARVFVSKLRKKLVGTGWEIRTCQDAGKLATYRLKRINDA